MSTHHQRTKASVRNVAWTHCDNGPLDLQPTVTTHSAGYRDAFIDFEAQSFHPALKFSEAAFWCPGYVEQKNGEVIKIGADLIALTSDGVTANQAHRWLVSQDLTGLVWPTDASTPALPACCVVLLLDSTVSQQIYKLIWLRLMREVFGSTPDLTQADFRHRFAYPRTPDGASHLLRHDGQSLPASYVFCLDAINGDVIAHHS